MTPSASDLRWRPDTRPPAFTPSEIGSALEAGVILTVPPADRPLLDSLRGELEEVFILSHLTVAAGEVAGATATKTSAARCERCWRHRDEVGSSADNPTLCARCEEAVVAGIS